jgi:uncharacterized damage-inducible protein DinB
MAIKDALLPEFDHEMAVTRSLLARVPDDRADWKPHPKSMSVGQLAAHIAALPGWMDVTMNQGEFDMNPPGGSTFVPPTFQGAAKLAADFDAMLVGARAALAGATDERMMEPWSLKNGGAVQFTLPRAAVVRSFVLNHVVHHRGQLSVYLRMLDVPLPSIYGPTADTK